jgi:glycosyltransferase involved in cell wall biosynthesis
VLARLGCVVIGRNEGDRLKRCLTSLIDRAPNIVYVDSGSTDSSVEMAQRLGVETVTLDMSVPFTAARARNAGFQRLLEKHSDVELVQFVDGDCEVVAGWLELAHSTLRARSELGVVFGRRRERFVDASIYNRVCDVEWDTPIGEAKSCGGDAMMRVAAVQSVGGYNDSLIAGEEPELCVRLRRQGWRIERLDAEMTLHDAAMTRFSQWWKRNVRSGYAFAEGSAMHGGSPDRHWVKESRRILFWGVVVPAVATVGALPTLGTSLLLFGGYPISAYRAYKHTRERGRSMEDAIAYSVSCTLGRWPELQGFAKYHWGKLRGKRSKIIEYKNPSG